MNIKLILDVAPPTPACFPSRTAWSEYLHSAQMYRKERQPFVGTVYQPEFNFCKDCTTEHKSSMRSFSKCVPSKFHKEVSHVCVL